MNIKKILKLFTNDVKGVFKNKITLFLICGLLILPSFYAWFNIYASWNPYGNTEGIKVAVSNKDLGATFLGKDLDIGEDLVENLKNENTLGWFFVDDEEEAIELARTGEVYASIIIPKDFSAKMVTILSENPTKPSLEYYVNEKINAIAPKITDKGVSTLQAEIGDTFIESLTEEVFSALEEADVTTEDISETFDSYKSYLDDLIEEIPTMVERLNTTANTVESGSELLALSAEDAELFENVLDDSISFTEDFKTDLNKLNSNTDEFSRELVETLNLIKVSIEDLDNNTVDLKERIVSDKPDVVEMLRGNSNDLKIIVSDISVIQNRLNDLDNNISPQISALRTTINNQLDDLDNLSNTIEKINLDDDKISYVIYSIISLNNNITSSLVDLSSQLEAISAYSENIDDISVALAGLVEKLNSATEVTEDIEGVIKGIIIDIKQLQSEIGDNKSPLYINLESISTLIEGLGSETSIETLNLALAPYLSVLSGYEDQYKISNTIVMAVIKDIDAIVYKLQTLSMAYDSIYNTINEFDNSIDNINYYVSSLQKDLKKTRGYTSTIYNLLENEKNYLTPFVKDITDLSLDRLNDISAKLNYLANNINDKNNAEITLDNVHNLNLNIISNLDSLIIKIDTDLTASTKRYLSGMTDFSSDLNVLLISINEKIPLIEDFLKKTANGGKIAADDMLRFGEYLLGLQEDLIKLSDRLNDFDERVDIERFSDILISNKNIVSDFMAYPVDLNTHSFYAVEYYGMSMTPFYTTLALWVGILVLAGLLTTKSKNIDLKLTPLESYLGKYLFFAMLAALQGLIVALGDLFILNVSAAEPVLFVFLTVFQSIVFCTIIYTLIKLFGNIGKALGVVFLVLQVAGAGGTFPIQMNPLFFQKLYAWLPFTYGIGALREAVSGVFYPALIKDINILIIYFIVFLVIGVLFVSRNHKKLELLSKKFEESGLSE